MTVSELIQTLTGFPGDAQVVVDYDLGYCRDRDLAVVADGPLVVVQTDAAAMQRNPFARR